MAMVVVVMWVIVGIHGEDAVVGDGGDGDSRGAGNSRL